MRLARFLIYLAVAAVGFFAMFLHALATRSTGRADSGGSLLGIGWLLVGVAAIAALYEWALRQRARRLRWRERFNAPQVASSGEPRDPLNHAMHLAMEWGGDFMKPTQPRLKQVYPTMSDAELDHLEGHARAAMKFGHDYVYAHPHATTDECIAAIRASFPWVSDANGSRAHSQGQYYAMK